MDTMDISPQICRRAGGSTVLRGGWPDRGLQPPACWCIIPGKRRTAWLLGRQGGKRDVRTGAGISPAPVGQRPAGGRPAGVRRHLRPHPGADRLCRVVSAALPRFVGDLSDSTTYAYQHDCLRAELDGQSVQVSGDELYQIYAVISNAGPGRLGWAPEEAPAALLDYGDGSYMQLWSVKLDNSSTSREYGLFLRYVDQEGRAYAYATDQLSLGEVTVYLAPSRD